MGFRNEPVVVATADKIAFVDRLSQTGLPVIEVSAFVDPRRVPQMGDAAEVFAGIVRRPGTRYRRARAERAGAGARARGRRDRNRAVRRGLGDVQPAQHQPVDRRVVRHLPDRRRSRGGRRPRGSRVSLHRVRLPVRRRRANRPGRGSHAAAARPRRLSSRGERHDRHGASRAGPAGCSRNSCAACLRIVWRCTFTTRAAPPWPTCWPRSSSTSRRSTPPPADWAAARTRPARTGNLATEDLLYMLNGLEITTGVTLDAVFEASLRIEPLLGHPLPSKYVTARKATEGRGA